MLVDTMRCNLEPDQCLPCGRKLHRDVRPKHSIYRIIPRRNYHRVGDPGLVSEQVLDAKEGRPCGLRKLLGLVGEEWATSALGRSELRDRLCSLAYQILRCFKKLTSGIFCQSGLIRVLCLRFPPCALEPDKDFPHIPGRLRPQALLSVVRLSFRHSTTLTSTRARVLPANMMQMDGGSPSSSSTDMPMMSMTFFTSPSTPLYSSAWTPGSTGSYAGTCVFVALLAALLRGLTALRAAREAAWRDADLRRRYVTVADKAPRAERMTAAAEPEAKRTTMVLLSENGVEEGVVVVVMVQGRDAGATRPWRITVDPVRAVLDTVIAGVGYLL